MADFIVLSDYPDIGDRKHALGDNNGRYFWHLLFTQRAPTHDLAVEFLYDTQYDMYQGNDRWRSIEARHKPKVVLVLGQTAMRNFPQIEGSLNECRGSVYNIKRPKREMYVIPTYHPRDLKHPIRLFGEEPVQRGYCAAGDIHRAATVYKEGWEQAPENFNIDPTVDEVEQFVEEAIKNQWLLGTDLEGTGLNIEHSAIVVAGFAWSESDAIVVPFRKEGGQSYYPPDEWERVSKALQRLFHEGRFMYQNGVGYDIPLLRARGWDIPFNNFEVDTMVMHHTLSPELPHKIGFISSQYGKQPFWKDSFLTRKESIFETDQKEMKIYNARDCVALHQIYNGMKSHMESLMQDDPVYSKLWEVFVDAMACTRVVIDMEEQGILLDTNKLAKWRSFLKYNLKRQLVDLQNLATLPPSFNLGSGDHLRFWLYGEPIKKLEKLNVVKSLEAYEKPAYNYQYACSICGRKRTKKFQPDLEVVPDELRVRCPKCKCGVVAKRTDKEPTSVKGKSKDTKKYAELKAYEELAHMKPLPKLRGYMPLTTASDTGVSATDKAALTRYSIHIERRIDHIENVLKRRTEKHDIELKDLKTIKKVLLKLQKYGKFKKLQESFWTFQTRQDGKVYPHFLVTGTATGRFSSKNPNFQQIPSGDEIGPWIRGCFKADPGYELMSADFSNLEVVIGAYFMEDEALIKIVEAGLNFHDENNKIFFGVKPTDPNWKVLRKVAKVIVFARLLYGGSDQGIYTKVMTQFPDCGLTLKAFKEAVENYMQAHPDYVKWCAKVVALATEKRISVNAFGRVRTLLGPVGAIGRQALNNPIQGSAADAVREDMVLLNKAFARESMKAKIILQIHDEFVFHYPIEEREKVAQVACIEVMGRERELNGRKFRIKVEPEVGKYWGVLNALNLETMQVENGSKH